MLSKYMEYLLLASVIFDGLLLFIAGTVYAGWRRERAARRRV